MLFEQLMLLILFGVVVFMVIIPIYKFIMSFVVKAKPNPLKEAKKRIAVAKAEHEAAILNKETEKLYDSLYKETLQDSEEFEDSQLKQKKV